VPVTCEQAHCPEPEPRGACCLMGNCIPDRTRENCEDVLHGTFMGPDTLCEDVTC
jgi:hypothetical protein